MGELYIYIQFRVIRYDCYSGHVAFTSLAQDLIFQILQLIIHFSAILGSVWVDFGENIREKGK